jgi:phosphoenolpyruvate carboxykinase (ATP)
MSDRTVSSALRGSIVEDDVELTMVELCRACRTSEQQIELWVYEGVLQPRGTSQASWRFGGDSLARMRLAARLTRDQAIYWFLSGFTSKLAGTEIGVQEPQPTFSTCFGAPFLPQPPSVYAGLLGRKLDEHPDARVWLVNTGWTGGPHGVGRRMPIQATRALLHAALSGTLEDVEYRLDEVFGLEVPVSVPGVDPSLLDPRGTWADPAAYDVKAQELARMFRDNFTRFEDVSAGVAGAGPRV